MAMIFNDDDAFVYGTPGDDTINCDGQARSIRGGRGDDFINPGIRVDQTSIIMVFGGNNAHDTRDGPDFRFGEPRANSGNDKIAVGQGIWGDGEDGRDFFESHGPSTFGKFMPRVWMDIGGDPNDRLSVDNSDHSRDRAIGKGIDGADFRTDGSGFSNGFELVNIHFARQFTKSGVDYAEVNGFTVHSLAKSPVIREQFTDVLAYDKGDDPRHEELIVRVGEGETARQAVSEYVHEHALPGADQFLF